jgi:hypothetical protein
MLLDNISNYSSCLISVLHSSAYKIPVYDKIFTASFHFDGENADYLCDVDIEPAKLWEVLEPITVPIVLKGINIWFLYQPMDLWYPFLCNLISKKTVIVIFHQELDLSKNINHLQILRDLTQLHIEFTPTLREILYKKASGKLQRETKIDKFATEALSVRSVKPEVFRVFDPDYHSKP